QVRHSLRRLHRLGGQRQEKRRYRAEEELPLQPASEVRPGQGPEPEGRHALRRYRIRLLDQQVRHRGQRRLQHRQQRGQLPRQGALLLSLTHPAQKAARWPMPLTSVGIAISPLPWRERGRGEGESLLPFPSPWPSPTRGEGTHIS